MNFPRTFKQLARCYSITPETLWDWLDTLPVETRYQDLCNSLPRKNYPRIISRSDVELIATHVGDYDLTLNFCRNTLNSFAKSIGYSKVTLEKYIEPIWDEVLEIGHQHSSRFLMPGQVKLIADYLGEKDWFSRKNFENMQVTAQKQK